MSNVKISQLPAASTFSPAADVAPIVHSGVTQKATLNQIVQAVLPSPGAIGSVTPSTAQFSALTLVSASGLQKAVGGLFTNAIAGTDYLPPTTGSAIQKANGVGGLTNATAGSDYAPPTAGTSILYGNGSGGFSNVTVGSGLTFASGTLASTSAGGSVTSVSVLTANGLAGTVANATTTPAITLSTTVTGLLKGNGTAISAAVSGTDYAPATTGTSILKGNGSGGFSNAVSNTDYQSVITATGILKGAGSGSISAAVVGTDYAPATSGTSILKGNGTGGFSSATAGTDYAAPTTGTNAQLLANNGSGGFSNVTVGSGLTYSAGTLAATAGGGGTVTDVSVVSANGFAGTVATSTTTPAITLSTSVTGLLKGNGTAVSAAVSGTDYAPATSGNSILYGNGSGGFSNVTVGSGLSFAAGTLTATGGGSGTVTSVSGTGTVSGISLSGTVTTSGSLTLGGTLDLSSPPAIGDTSPNTGAFTRVTVTGSTAPANGLYLPATNALGFSTNSTERVRIDSSGNVGIGTSSPSYKLSVQAASANTTVANFSGANANRGLTIKTFQSNSGDDCGVDFSAFASPYGSFKWTQATSTVMTLDSSGNLGLGVTPSAWNTSGTYFKAIELGSVGSALAGLASGQQTSITTNAYYNSGWKYAGTGTAMQYYQSGGVHYWQTAPSGTAGNAISFTQAMTLDTNGFLSVNWVPDNNSAGVSSKTSQSGQQTFTGWNAATSGTRYYAYFGTGSTFTNTGSITTTGSNCLFNSGSDYRLKDNPQRIQGAIHTIEKLNPVTFTWKSNGEEDQGFIAHELQNVIPQVVVGEKDAIDDFGRPQYQTVDYSKLTAILTAAIQELSAELNELKQKVNA